MKKGLALLSISAILTAHSVDLHIKTPSEMMEEERMHRQQEIDEAIRVYEDQDRSEEERRAALATLLKREEMS